MQTISFLSSRPFDHVPRALDMLRKMHFGLVRLSVEPSDGEFEVTVAFEQRGALSTEVFINRLAQLEGLVLSDRNPAALAVAVPETCANPRPLHVAAFCY